MAYKNLAPFIKPDKKNTNRQEETNAEALQVL